MEPAHASESSLRMLLALLARMRIGTEAGGLRAGTAYLSCD
jgi:hypothetical protein